MPAPIDEFRSGETWPNARARLNALIKRVNALANISGDGIIEIRNGPSGLTAGLSVEQLLARIPKLARESEVIEFIAGQTGVASLDGDVLSAKLTLDKDAREAKTDNWTADLGHIHDIPDLPFIEGSPQYILQHHPAGSGSPDVAWVHSPAVATPLSGGAKQLTIYSRSTIRRICGCTIDGEADTDPLEEWTGGLYCDIQTRDAAGAWQTSAHFEWSEAASGAWTGDVSSNMMFDSTPTLTTAFNLDWNPEVSNYKTFHDWLVLIELTANLVPDATGITILP